MPMNLVRTGSAGVLGVASGVLTPPTVAPLLLGTTPIEWGLVAEAVGTIGGAGLQLLAPHMLPDVADGLVDGGVALLLKRGTEWAITQMKPPAAAMVGSAPQYAQRVNPQVLAGGYVAPSYSRGQVGVSTSRKKLLT